jgi:hypothetical protein
MVSKINVKTARNTPNFYLHAHWAKRKPASSLGRWDKVVINIDELGKEAKKTKK